MFVIFIYASINTYRHIVFSVRLLIVSSNDTVKQSVHNLLAMRGKGEGEEEGVGAWCFAHWTISRRLKWNARVLHGTRFRLTYQ